MIIALTGKMLSGKSTVARMLQDLDRQAVVLKFADPLYKLQEHCYNYLHLPSVEKDRLLLQNIGSHFRKVNINTFTNMWEYNYSRLSLSGKAPKVVIVDDLRYDNEAEMLKSLNANIIHIHSDNEERVMRNTSGTLVNTNHESESGIYPDYYTHSINNNGSIEDLKEAVKELYASLQHKN